MERPRTDATTRIGQLERGRGAGYRAAVAAGPVARDEVLACVLDDPRWDRQVEERDEHYARLAIALAVDPEPIGERLRELVAVPPERESDTWLPIGTLAEMARRGSAPAVGQLRALVREGVHWRNILLALDVRCGREAMAAILDEATIAGLVGSTTPAELVEATHEIDGPWDRWREAVPSLRFVLRRAGEAIEVAPRAGPIGWVAPKLAASPAPEPPPEIDASGPDRLAEADAVLRREAAGEPLASAERRRWVQYLVALPAERTLPIARAWLGEAWPLSHAAEEIFTRHAGPEDRTMLEETAATAIRHGLWYRLGSMVDALGQVGDARSIEVLAAAYEQASYSYVRRRVVAALRAHGRDPRAAALLGEALWDCETECRLIACEMVDRGVLPWRARLVELAGDPCEDSDVQGAARTRII